MDNSEQEESVKPMKSWKLRLIQSFGLTNYLLSKFVFRPPPLNYVFEKDKSRLLRFYPIIQNRRVTDIYQQQLEIKSYIIYTTPRAIPNCSRKSGCMVPIIHIRKPNNREMIENKPKDFDVPFRQSNNVQKEEGFKLKQRARSCHSMQWRRELKKSKTKSKPHIGDIRQKRLLVLYSHGNASDLGDVYFFGERIVWEYDVDFVGYDYSGYGIGVGSHEISEAQIYMDLQYTLSFCIDQLQYELPQIILWGFSLGSGPTIEIASRFSGLGGVILQSPIASLVLWLEKERNKIAPEEEDIFSNINKIQAIRTKIIIMHGEEDTIINVRHSQLLFNKYQACNPQMRNNIILITVPQRDHNNLQDLILTTDHHLGKEIFRFFKLIEVDRATLQMNTFYHTVLFIIYIYISQDWPREEILKLNNKKENVKRETTLLKLMNDDYCISHTGNLNQQPRKYVINYDHTIQQTKKQGPSSVKPIEELHYQNVEFLKPRPPYIQDYRSMLQNKTNSSSLLQSRITQRQLPPTIQQKKERGFFANCLCVNDDSTII